MNNGDLAAVPNTYGVGDFVDLVIAKGNEQTVSDELNVLVHECRVHANECDGESIWIHVRRDEYIRMNNIPVKNSCSILTASTMILRTVSG